MRIHHRAGLLRHPGTDRKRYKGGGGTTTQPIQQVSSSGPWSGQQPYLAGGQVSIPDPNNPFAGMTREVPGLFPEAQRWYESNQPQYFPGQTVVGFNPMQTGALENTANIAGGPNPLMGNAYNTASAYAGGDFSNQAIQGVLEANRAAITPSIDARFMQSGRSWSPAHAASLGTAITNANAPYLFGAQQQGIQAAPTLSAARYNDPNMMLQAGQTQQAQAQAEKNAEIERWNQEQFKQQNKLAALGAMLAGNYGGQSTTEGTQAVPSGGGLGGWGSFLGGVGSLARGVGGLGGGKGK